jgi:predicted glutamine amidotransferase
MVIMGVVQVVDDDNNNNNNNNHEYVRYCMLHGIPRADVVLPQTVVEDILEAQAEVTRSKERCRILKQVLSSNSTNPREVFKQILLEYPEIAQDPIYVAALRNVHVDMSAVDRERFKQQRQMTTTHQEQTQATTTTTSKEAMTRSESLELKMSSQQHDSTVVMTTSSDLTKNESGESKTNDTTVASVVQDMIKTEEKLVEDEKK